MANGRSRVYTRAFALQSASSYGGLDPAPRNGSALLRAPLLVVLLGSLLVSAVGWSPTWAQGPLSVSTLLASQVKPGMKGYGLTVFRGQTPERFGVEVIDVLHNFRPSQDLILIRTFHPILDNAIVVGGMSGSPIYIDGKLIGAYAYGWSFGKDPVAGVTPIASMLAEIARPLDPRIWKSLGTMPALTGQAKRAPVASARSNAPRAASFATDRASAERLVTERTDAFSALRAHAAKLGMPATAGATRAALTQATTPLLVSGMTPSAVRMLARELEPFGIVPLEAGGGASPAAKSGSTPAPRFVDGGAIGVQLIRGDINASAIGTVTHVAGDRLVAFGHPMLNAGQVGLPTSTSRVLHVLASQMRSFKIAEPIAPLGTLIHDRQAAIVIDQKLRADTVPVRVRIHGAPGMPRSEWNMEVASHRLLTPSLTFSAAYSALSATIADNADAVFRVTSKVFVEGHGEVETTDTGYASGGAADPMVLSRMRLFAVLGAAYGNPFEDARISRIELDFTIDFAHDVVTIVDAMVPSDEVDPGKPTHVYVTLRGWDEREEVKILSLPIPQSAAGETVEIAIEPGDAVQLEEPKPASLDDLLAAVSHGYPGTSLVMSARLPSQGVRLRGQLVRSLPGSALDTLQPVNAADRGATFPTLERTEVPLGRVVTGSVKIKLNVRREPRR